MRLASSPRRSPGCTACVSLCLRRSPALADALLKKRFFEEVLPVQRRWVVAADMERARRRWRSAINLLVVALFCDFWGAAWRGARGRGGVPGGYRRIRGNGSWNRPGRGCAPADLDGEAVAEDPRPPSPPRCRAGSTHEFGGDGMGIALASLVPRATPRASSWRTSRRPSRAAPSTEDGELGVAPTAGGLVELAWTDLLARSALPAAAGNDPGCGYRRMGWAAGADPLGSWRAWGRTSWVRTSPLRWPRTLLASPAVRGRSHGPSAPREIGPHVSYDLAGRPCATPATALPRRARRRMLRCPTK